MPKLALPAPVRRKGKILPSVLALADVVQEHRKKGKTIVQCHGVFDLLHPGHIRHFASAKHEGDILVVTVTPDRFVNKGPGRPVFNEHLRAESVAALETVDYVAINEWPSAVEAIALLRPHVYAKGNEYRNPEQDVTGKILLEEQAVHKTGGRLHFTDDITFSSSKLLNAYFPVLAPEAREYLSGFCESYDGKTIIDMLQELKKLKVLVVGDAIVDEYHLCKVLGRASKADCLNAKFLNAEMYAGGALAVANHVAGFCGQVDLLTVLGKEDSREEFIRARLRPNVRPTFLFRPDAPTTVKRRFLDVFRYHKMFEVSFLHEQPLPDQAAEDLHQAVADIGEYDLVLIADFGHGMLDPATIALLAKNARYLAVNAQTNSANTGYNPVTKYPRADYVCVDQEEIRLAYHDRFGSVDDLIRRLGADMQCSTVAVTCGQQGSIVFRDEQSTMARTPVFSTEVIDTVGAGDAYLSITAPCAALGYPADVIGFLGNAAGALAIRVLGNREPVNPVALAKFVDVLLKH